MRLMLMMFMMLACVAHWRRGVAADAHDAGLPVRLARGIAVRLMLMMLMMLACLAHWRRAIAADAHDAGLSGWLGKLGCG